MSGIFGIIDTQRQPLKEQWLMQMMESLSHRGKDGRGYRLEDHAGIGHLLLEINPEHRNEQSPLIYGHLVVAADSRLDDRETLCRALGLPFGENKTGPSDHLLIARAYEKWGENCVDHLLGDFAFAVWDTTAQSLFCARDHVGVKPFFYCLADGKFVFASEIKAIADLPFVPRKLNEGKLADHILTFSWSGEHVAETFFQGIDRLMPARRLSLEKGRIATSVYWEPRHRHTLRLSSDEEYAMALRELMEQAVNDRLRTEYPIGVQLSGGLDSSSIACIAARQLAQRNKPLFAASSVLPDDYKGPEKDERQFIEEVVRQEQNIQIDYVSVPERKIFSGIGKAFDKVYGPVNAFHYMDDALDETLSQKRGARVVLDGLLGDMTVSYIYNSSLAHLVRTLRLQSAWQLFKKRTKTVNSSAWNVFKNEILRPFIPPDFLKTWQTLYGRPPVPFIESTAAAGSFISARDAEKKYKSFLQQGWSQTDVYRGIWSIHMNLLDEESCIRQARHHVEHVFPWLDKRIIEFMFSLPPEQFLHKGWYRGLIRFAMDGILPQEVQWRKSKGAFSPDYIQRIAREIPEIRQNIANWELDSSKYGMVDFKKIKKMLEQLQNGKNSHTFDNNFITITGVGLITCEFVNWFNNLKPSNFNS